MKYLLLLSLMLVSIKNFACPSYINENSWRWRNNDGDETSATWKAGQSTAASYNVGQGTVRLRIEIINNYRGTNIDGQCNGYAYNLQDSLQYSTTFSDASSWKNIGNDSSKAFVLAGTNAYVTQSTLTTPQLTGVSNSFSNGKVMVSDSVTNFIISAVNRTEVEWAIVGTSSMIPGIPYYFRQYNKFNRRYSNNSYAILATTAPPLPVSLTRFSINGEGSKARLDWETASEQNNDRFEVQRSPDQRIWQTVATVKGKGNSTTPVSYTAYDEKPLNGTSYYRLQQFDKDGKSTYSEIRFFKKTDGGASVSVWPNPVKDIISFSLGNTDVRKLDAVLSDAGGRIIFRQTFTNIVPSAINKLNLLQKPAPGVYLLQLKGDGLSESVKILVQ